MRRRRILIAAAPLLALAMLPALPAAAQVEQVALVVGCNNISLTWPNGTAATEVAAAVAPAAALVAIWRFDAVARRFLGFSPQFPQVSDLRTLNRLDAVFLCVRADATLTRPALGVAAPAPAPAPAPPAPAGRCDPSYPTVCIPPPPPDLDCPEIPHRNFPVRSPDPHRFDADRDGIGCET